MKQREIHIGNIFTDQINYWFSHLDPNFIALINEEYAHSNNTQYLEQESIDAFMKIYIDMMRISLENEPYLYNALESMLRPLFPELNKVLDVSNGDELKGILSGVLNLIEQNATPEEINRFFNEGLINIFIKTHLPIPEDIEQRLADSIEIVINAVSQYIAFGFYGELNNILNTKRSNPDFEERYGRLDQQLKELSKKLAENPFIKPNGLLSDNIPKNRIGMSLGARHATMDTRSEFLLNNFRGTNIFADGYRPMLVGDEKNEFLKVLDFAKENVDKYPELFRECFFGLNEFQTTEKMHAFFDKAREIFTGQYKDDETRIKTINDFLDEKNFSVELLFQLEILGRRAGLDTVQIVGLRGNRQNESTHKYNYTFSNPEDQTAFAVNKPNVILHQWTAANAMNTAARATTATVAAAVQDFLYEYCPKHELTFASSDNGEIFLLPSKTVADKSTIFGNYADNNFAVVAVSSVPFGGRQTSELVQLIGGNIYTVTNFIVPHNAEAYITQEGKMAFKVIPGSLYDKQLHDPINIEVSPVTAAQEFAKVPFSHRRVKTELPSNRNTVLKHIKLNKYLNNKDVAVQTGKWEDSPNIHFDTFIPEVSKIDVGPVKLVSTETLATNYPVVPYNQFNTPSSIFQRLTQRQNEVRLEENTQDLRGIVETQNRTLDHQNRQVTFKQEDVLDGFPRRIEEGQNQMVKSNNQNEVVKRSRRNIQSRRDRRSPNPKTTNNLSLFERSLRPISQRNVRKIQPPVHNFYLTTPPKSDLLTTKTARLRAHKNKEWCTYCIPRY